MTTNGAANGHDAAGLVGIRAAARAVGVNPSTISRYLKDHPELNLGDGVLPKMDLAALRRHRAANLNPAMRGSHAGRLLGEGEVEETPAAGPIEAPPAATRSGETPNYARAKAMREETLAQRARVDLDEKRALLVPREEAEAAAYEIGALLQRDLLDLGAQLGERLAAMDDPREIAALMEAEYRRVLAALAASLRETAAAEELKAHPAAEVIPT